jgi:hypothetical protein
MEIEKVLHIGVTKPCLDQSTRSSWLAAVHECVRVTDGAVTTSVEEPAVGRNYYRVGVRMRDGAPLALLLNAAAALVAATTPGNRQSLTATFVNVPAGEIFSRAGFQVAMPTELDQPVKDEHLQLLAEDERRDVLYHQPDRLGDLLFNWFD